MGRPRQPRTSECETCHPYHCDVCLHRLGDLSYAERVKVASHYMEHLRLDRRRETYLRYDRKRRRTYTSSPAADPEPAAVASSGRSRKAA